MKVRSLLFVGLAGVALSSCGGLKSYKTEVKMKTFIEELERLEGKSPLISENPYSFVFESSQEEGYKIINMQNNKELSKAEEKEKSEYKVKFDSVNCVMAYEAESTSSYKDPSKEEKDEYSYDRVYQKDNKNWYHIDKNADTYVKEESSDSEKYVGSVAMSQAYSLINAFESHVMQIGDEGKYYIDDNVYTVVLDSTDENTSRTKHIKTICQLTVNDDSYEYYCSDTTEITELHRKDIDTDVIKGKLTKKSVILDPIDLHSYLEVKDLDFPAF
ncbi:MAG: hypothetical protein KBS97_00500 [Firmicutes bacterium]|nr:hypothetical protein [Candidatus Fiminaster equi]